MQPVRGKPNGGRGIVVVLSVIASLCAVRAANAKGPFGTIHAGNWIGGAYTDDTTGAFSHCGASASFVNGTFLMLGRNARG